MERSDEQSKQNVESKNLITEMGEELKNKPRSTAGIPTCPTLRRWAGDLVGCGSSNVVWDEWDELYDCFNCGLFFNREQAFLNQKSPKQAVHE